jgi:hypothetical protein
MGNSSSRSTRYPLIRAVKVTYLYTALCVYLGTLAAFLGWWARFPR